ncbi:hypothetical protein Hrd1104_11040 [Halorhabdus sp. CBA1104]|nr:hypothetical protein Hrd1104_11040 [Halorhabdus sp. CBA1104]
MDHQAPDRISARETVRDEREVAAGKGVGEASQRRELAVEFRSWVLETWARTSDSESNRREQWEHFSSAIVISPHLTGHEPRLYT